VLLASHGFEPLAPGFSVSPGKPPVTALPSHTFGPEVSFGRTLADKLPGHHVVLIKFCEGGTNLKAQWNPDRRGRLYDQFIEHVHKSLKLLDDRHDTYTLRGMAWHQGESDAGVSADEYQQLLTRLIERVRTDLNAKELPFVIGEVYDNGKRDTIRAAQRATAEAVPHVAFAPCDGLKTFDGGTHFDAASQIELGRRMAEAMLELIGGKE
jgi:iduronate 2-sulfatase